jgi:hypothetical protein
MLLIHCASVKQFPAGNITHVPIVVLVMLHTLPGRAVLHTVNAFSAVHVGAVAVVAVVGVTAHSV